ncbi:DNA-directed RNA polymerase, beta subunit/140 kD subunit [Microbacterium laevaniformans OR221]|nr:DNA-directed RNA polymerase, beta subunit/140 kD subunit [Microbacterium laevaniformans OR221]
MSDEPRDYHRPVHRPADTFDRRFGSTDPADVSRIAHATASALITRVRDEPTDAVVERLITFTDAHGLETVAELWSHSPAKSLPGTLWRLYLLQLMVRDDAATAALLYERGRTVLHSVDDVVAGAPTPAGPEELITLVAEILRGVFTGDFAVALERAASFCRVEAAGAADLADDYDDTEPNRASTFTTRALRLDTYAGDLTACAGLWRRDALT